MGLPMDAFAARRGNYIEVEFVCGKSRATYVIQPLPNWTLADFRQDLFHIVDVAAHHLLQVEYGDQWRDEYRTCKPFISNATYRKIKEVWQRG